MDNNNIDDVVKLTEEISDGISNTEERDVAPSDPQRAAAHHSHHSGHRRKKHRHRAGLFNKKTGESIKHFLVKNKRYLIHATITLVAIVCLIAVGSVIDKKYSSQKNPQWESKDPTLQNTVNSLKIDVPFFAEDVVLVNPAVYAYYSAEDGTYASDVYDQYRSQYDRMDVGLPVKLSYKLLGAPIGCSVKNARCFVADNPEFTDQLVYTADGYSTSIDVYHLKTGTRYYFKIELTFNDGNVTTVSGSFKTAESPRFLTVGGVYNLRDVGGWNTSDGRVINQGLLYRGCELDGAVEEKYTITPEGVNTMLSVFGIKTDMDLREPTDNLYGLDALGAGVDHVYYSAPNYSAIFDHPEPIRKVFSDLADRSNYPIYLHCTYGQDRTGTVCYLLGAILGMDESSLMKEYQLSAFHHSDVSMDWMYKFIGRINGLPGDSVNEKIEGWLLSIGVTAEEISSIRDIFLSE
ncbi:MAG: tyrosine-protein phosphatase [Clostridia bacterium]|nr:tyrosine-protein phosphatase [Clostridia bacterium]